MDTHTIERPSARARQARPERGRGQDGQPRPAGRRRPWRVRLGRAGPPAGGRAHRVRGRVGHQCRGDERGGAGLWPGRRRPRGAQTALTGFWRRISHAAAMGPLQPSPVDRVLHNHALDYSPAFLMLDFMSRMLSPYQLNPANYNPLQHVLEQSVDFDRLRALAPVSCSCRRPMSAPARSRSSPTRRSPPTR